MKIMPNINLGLLQKSITFIKPFMTKIILLYVFTIFSHVIELLPTYYMGKIIDYTINKNFHQILHTIFILLFLFVISSISSFIETYLTNLLKNKITYLIKNSLFSKIIILPAERFDEFRAGDFISRIEGDTNIIAKLFIEDILNIILSVTTIVVTGFFIFRISFTLSIFGLLTFPINFIITILYGKAVRRLSLEGKKINDDYYSFLQEALNAIYEIKCLNIIDDLIKKYFSFSNLYIKNNMKISMAQTFSGLFNQSVSSVSEWIIIAYGCWLIIQEKITVGNYVAFNGYLQRLMSAVQSILSVNITLQMTSVALERIYDLLDAISEKQDETNSVLITHGNIRIRDLTFRYTNTTCDIINGISMEIPSNSLSAIVGFSGCGKSTLLKLLVRLYEHTKGNIEIDGFSIQNINLSILRNSIAYIQQEPFLFNSSIKDNLLLVDPWGTLDQIVNACKLANIDQFIQTLPQKYDTIIGEGGIRLSGGQKQMLSIARAILKKSKILLLDEITSDLDGESEFYIMRSIHELAKNHTVIMIAHRLSSIIDFPKIFVFNEGIIEDDGNHEELINRCETYKRLFSRAQYMTEYTAPMSCINL